MAQKIQRPKGFNDVLPAEIGWWHRLEDAARRVFGGYGYDEIRTPILENTELFARAVGAATDVVEKEMFTFNDREKRSLTLRPEGTAGVVRAYVENGLAQNEPSSRFWYAGPMFRHENVQAGRFRQFSQIGVEAFGARAPRVDAEVLIMVRDYLDAVGIRGVDLRVSSLGDAKCRPAYKQELQTFLRGVAGELCDDCKRRIETNPLRVLDCKNERCRAATAKAPRMLERLCDECRAHWDEVTRTLKLAGVAFTVDPDIVRGLDYYVRTSFELIHVGEGLGAQKAIGGGGRYDGLVRELGGPDVPGVGFGLGVERMVMVLDAQEKKSDRPKPKIVFLAPLGPAAADRAMALARDLRAAGLRVEMDYDAKEKGLGNTLNKADRRAATIAVILGADELARGIVKVKDLRSGAQVEHEIASLVGVVKGMLGD